MNNVIYINGRFLTQKTTGVQRVATEIIKEFDELLNNKEYKKRFSFILLVPKNEECYITLKNIKIKVINTPFLSGHLWEQFVLPLYSKKNLLINFCNTGPLFKRKQLVFIHDAAIRSYPKAFSKKFILWYRILYRFISLFSLKVITVSQFSKNELLKYYPYMHAKLEVIYNGVDHITKFNSNDDIIKKHGLDKREYILAVSSANPNKNFNIISEAIAKFNHFEGDVIIVGGKYNNIFSMDTNSNNTKIKLVGYVTDEELVSLYYNAKVFIFPSLYEGFGIPPLEAMALGCPVISSKASSMPEILGDNALYFDPKEVNELVEKINFIFNDQYLTNNIMLKGKEHAKKFTWKNTATRLLEIIVEEKK